MSSSRAFFVAKFLYTVAMFEIALYRKYRPQKFSEVVGQEPIIKVLQSAIAARAVAHAYLFAGARGTGKTSVARILARALDTSANDLYEIDAASNRGIDEIRALREAVRTLPFDSQYKIYIIDEAHMLTKDAFNALLKTLEEPPAHVIFILATTEAHKLPETIISRCQNFTFRQPSLLELKNLATRVAKNEGYQLEATAADLIALAGDGSFRDTLGVLQKTLTVSVDKKLIAREVEKVIGAPSARLITDFTDAALNQDVTKGLAVLRQAAENHQEMKTFLKLVMRRLRLAMLLKFAPTLRSQIITEISPDELKELEILIQQPVATRLAQLLRECLEIYDEVGKTYLPTLPLELLLLNHRAV